ncbi:MAG: hypothetical protein QNJ38_07810 [Prochloraceae cyanobacterium]|nr:hypothetical protein [Prochloraceae cyanobacterium]
MTTDFDILRNKEILAPVVFRSYFNEFRDINATQAWSLFFTAGKEDKVLGFNRELGGFFTTLLIAISVTGIAWSLFFSNFFSVSSI